VRRDSTHTHRHARAFLFEATSLKKCMMILKGDISHFLIKGGKLYKNSNYKMFPEKANKEGETATRLLEINSLFLGKCFKDIIICRE